MTVRKTQKTRILWLLQSAWPNWTPAIALSQISLMYGSRVSELRSEGWLIQNRVRIVNGIRHGEFRFGPRPVPSNAELRRSAGASLPTAPSSDSLFPETTRHRDDG